MPDEPTSREGCERRWGANLTLGDEPMAYQLVGGVKAYQGEDG